MRPLSNLEARRLSNDIAADMMGGKVSLSRQRLKGEEDLSFIYLGRGCTSRKRNQREGKPGPGKGLFCHQKKIMLRKNNAQLNSFHEKTSNSWKD